jgi:CheY-like chemotaxis protein
MERNIVIVDDDPDALEILGVVLGTLEIPIRQASDGIEALNLIAQDPPLMVLLDLSMPKLDGRGVLEKMRANSKLAHIPVIVFTAHIVTPDLAEELQVPLSHIACKGTLSMTELRGLVVNILSGLDVDWSSTQRIELMNPKSPLH